MASTRKRGTPNRKDLFELALEYGITAFSFLKRGQIPPTPEFYELLYAYATGANKALNEKINAMFSSGKTPDLNLARLLHDEFFQPRDMGQKLDSVSAEIATRIDAIHGALDNAMVNAANYGDLLESANGNLEGEISKQSLHVLTGSLLTETRVMQTANKELEGQLDNARNDISALQRELDEVRRESMLDPLTRIDNRKSFDRSLEHSIVKADKLGDFLSLLLIDIDHFKRFNDSFGHQAGDQVLRLVAKTLMTNVKEEDLAARYGGEEFAIILPGTSLKDAITVADRLRKAVQTKELLKRSTKENLGKVTVSIGAATFRAGDSVQSLIERADLCLYAAKDAGRNKVVDEDMYERNNQPGSGKESAA